MQRAAHVQGIVLSAALVVLLSLATPSLGYAQERDVELQATIRAAILFDPRTAEMSEEEVGAMVAALSEKAASQGVTSHDIAWRPTEEQAGESSPCGSIKGFLCTLTDAFGFTGSDLAIPIGLGISSALLLFLIGMLLHRLGHHPVAGSMTPTDS